MYPTHNEGKAVVVERFTRTLKRKCIKKTANNSKFYLDHLFEEVSKWIQ